MTAVGRTPVEAVRTGEGHTAAATEASRHQWRCLIACLDRDPALVPLVPSFLARHLASCSSRNGCLRRSRTRGKLQRQCTRRVVGLFARAPVNSLHREKRRNASGLCGRTALRQFEAILSSFNLFVAQDVLFYGSRSSGQDSQEGIKEVYGSAAAGHVPQRNPRAVWVQTVEDLTVNVCTHTTVTHTTQLPR